MNRIGPQFDANRPHVVAFGGGKGGVGRSTLCAEVARSLARRDERVLCVDAAWGCPALNTLLSAEEPRFGFGPDDPPPLGEEGSHIADFIQPTDVDNTWLASIAAGRKFPYFRPDLSAFGLIEQLHALEFDWIFLDLAPGLDPFDVGLFTLSDIPVIVATPEPGSVRAATQFLRHALFQSVRYHPDCDAHRDHIEDLLFAQGLDLSAPSLRSQVTDPDVAQIVDESIDRFEPYLIVNLVREGAEQDLGFVLCHAWHESLGISPRFLTSVDYENRRWFYHRRTTGTNAVRGDEALSRDIETLAQLALDISAVDARYPRPIPDDDDLHPALRLGISPDSSRNEVRQHCRRLWEGYKREKSVDMIFGDPDRRQEISEELETLYRKVLTLPSDTFDTVDRLERPPGTNVGLSAASSSSDVRSTSTSSQSHRGRSAADATSSGQYTAPSSNSAEDSEEEESEDLESTDQDPAAVHAHDGGEEEPESEPEPVPEVGRSDESPGALVEALRRRESISLQALSRRTHVGVKYLAAIEDGEIDVLPRPVYLRGYLREIARTFNVDPDELVREYVKRLDDDRV